MAHKQSTLTVNPASPLASLKRSSTSTPEDAKRRKTTVLPNSLQGVRKPLRGRGGGRFGQRARASTSDTPVMIIPVPSTVSLDAWNEVDIEGFDLVEVFMEVTRVLEKLINTIVNAINHNRALSTSVNNTRERLTRIEARLENVPMYDDNASENVDEDQVSEAMNDD